MCIPTIRTRRILHVPRRFTLSSWGGTETVVLETAREEQRRGHSVRILTTRALDARSEETIGGVAVERFPYFYPYLGLSESGRDRMDRVGGNLVSLQLMSALLAGPRPDLVHLHTGKRLGGIVRVATRLRGVPYVVTLHGGAFDVPGAESAALVAPARGTFEWGKAVGWALGARRVLADAAAVICVGAAEAELVQARYPAVKVVHLPNGVDAGRFASGDGSAFRARHGIPADAELVLSVGRIDPQKNQGLILDAVERLVRRRPRVRVALMGPVTDAEYARTLAERAMEQGLAGRVHIVPAAGPESSELADAYHAADVFCLSSRHEPFGIVILEAWAAGRPVVATRVGGVPSFVRDGADCVLVAPGDATAMAAALESVLAVPARAIALANAGQARAVREFSWQHRTDRQLALYEEVLS